MSSWMRLLAFALCSMCLASFAASETKGPDALPANLPEAARSFTKGYSWLVQGAKVVYDFEGIDTRKTDAGTVQEKTTGVIEIECTKIVEGKAEIQCTSRLTGGEIVDEKGAKNAVSFAGEIPVTMRYLATERGNPQIVSTEKDFATEITKVGQGPHREMYGRPFRGADLALLEMPSPEDKPDDIGYFAWRGSQRVGGAARQLACEASPLGNQMVIIGRDTGRGPQPSSLGITDEQGRLTHNKGLTEAVAAVFEGGRIKSAEYRVSIGERTMMARITEKR